MSKKSKTCCFLNLSNESNELPCAKIKTILTN
jgi:hypothetical protein